MRSARRATRMVGRKDWMTSSSQGCLSRYAFFEGVRWTEMKKNYEEVIPVAAKRTRYSGWTPNRPEETPGKARKS